MTSPELNRSLLSSVRRSLAGSNHHPERAAGPDRVHLLRQDGDSDSEHHAVQEVHHRWTQLRYRFCSFPSCLFVGRLNKLLSGVLLTPENIVCVGKAWPFNEALTTADVYCETQDLG